MTARLTAEQVADIARLIRAKRSPKQIAALVGIKVSQVNYWVTKYREQPQLLHPPRPKVPMPRTLSLTVPAPTLARLMAGR